MSAVRYRTWAGSLLHPQTRLLPGIGARLGRYPRLAAAVFAALRRLPTARLRALAQRHAAMPIARRIEGRIVVRAVGGVRIHADPPDPLGRAILTAGVWEWNVGAAIRRILRPGDVFVDAGANAGYYAVLAAGLVGPSGHVYAIEPAPSTFAKLERNIALNGFRNVVAVQAAAGAARATATLHGRASGHDAFSSIHRRPDGTSSRASEVLVLPLWSIVAKADFPRLRLVKIDVEGYEDEVLRGLEPLLEEGFQPALLVEVHAAFNPRAPTAVAQLCSRYGYRARWLPDAECRLAPADRALVLADLGDPPNLDKPGEDRFVVLLEPR